MLRNAMSLQERIPHINKCIDSKLKTKKYEMLMKYKIYMHILIKITKIYAPNTRNRFQMEEMHTHAAAMEDDQEKLSGAINLGNWSGVYRHMKALGSNLNKFTNSCLSTLRKAQEELHNTSILYISSQYALERSRTQMAEIHSKSRTLE